MAGTVQRGRKGTDEQYYHHIMVVQNIGQEDMPQWSLHWYGSGNGLCWDKNRCAGLSSSGDFLLCQLKRRSGNACVIAHTAANYDKAPPLPD